MGDESVDIDFPNSPNGYKSLKLFLVHPGDEIFFILDWFPYQVESLPSKMSLQPHSEYWIRLWMKANKEKWKIDQSLSSMFYKNNFILCASMV